MTDLPTETCAPPKKSREERDREIMENVSADVILKAEKFLSLHDFDFFLKEATLSDVSKAFRNQYSLKMKVSHLNVLMRLTAKSACEYYRKKLKATKSHSVADPEYWEKLKAAVEEMLPQLSGEQITLPKAERIVRTRISTNQKLLQGLPKRLRVWEVQ